VSKCRRGQPSQISRAIGVWLGGRALRANQDHWLCADHGQVQEMRSLLESIGTVRDPDSSDRGLCQQLVHSSRYANPNLRRDVITCDIGYLPVSPNNLNRALTPKLKWKYFCCLEDYPD